MDRSRKKIRICLICIVITAIIVGIFYYYYSTQNQYQVNEGVLITQHIKAIVPWL